MPTAYTRAVSPLLDACALTHIARVPINIPRAIAQHAGYEAALRAAGCTLRRLPDLPDAPDGVFVEDTAIVLGAHAIITRPGVASRATETTTTAATLAATHTIHHLSAGTLDGGDVLRVNQTLFCGLSARTDQAGAAALAALTAPLGFTVIPLPVRGCLHLKTGVTYLGPNAAGVPHLLLNPAWVDPAGLPDLPHLHTASTEPFGANTLRLGNVLLTATSAPVTNASLARHGYDTHALDISELQHAEAGLTCMSLIG